MSGTPAMRLTMLANLKGKFHCNLNDQISIIYLIFKRTFLNR